MTIRSFTIAAAVAASTTAFAHPATSQRPPVRPDFCAPIKNTNAFRCDPGRDDGMERTKRMPDGISHSVAPETNGGGETPEKSKSGNDRSPAGKPGKRRDADVGHVSRKNDFDGRGSDKRGKNRDKKNKDHKK